MVEVSSLAAGALNAATEAAKTVKPEPSPETVARFEQLQTAGPAQPAGQTPAPATEVEPAELKISPVDGETAGDSILRGLDKMSKGFDSTVGQIAQAVNSIKPGETINAADLLKLQFQLTEVTVQQDVTSKVAGKATQSLETFLKNQ
jgi:type III secretion system YscI/HrpB-like protein